jgi:agmatine/peptidylarginine deiminase
MAVKFLDVDTLMVAESRPGQRWYAEFEAIAEQLAQTSSSTGRSYRIVRGPVVTGVGFHFWSYVNSLTLNRKVIIPSFGEGMDRTAQRVYQEHMREHEVAAINFRDFPVGASHCQSKEVPLPLVAGLRS